MPKPSSRIPSQRTPTALARARAALLEIPFDLTVTNPTLCGLGLPADALVELADARGARYNPAARGPAAARQAVARSYAAFKAEVGAGQIVLTASTSEAYGFLFKAYADPGSSILVPAPSYPLFETLAALDGLEPVLYSLYPEDGWRLDLAELAAAPDSTRALVVVHPNNPSGSLVAPEDRRRLIELARRRDWLLIADEVFLPFVFDPASSAATSFASTSETLCCSLGGFSKSLGAPQLKLAWIALNGPEEQVVEAVTLLEYVADAYLSVSIPVALAAPQWIQDDRGTGAGIRSRCRRNLDLLVALCEGCPLVTLWPPEGGWSAVLQVPALGSDEDLAIELLEQCGVAVHPGHLFDFPGDGYLVLSLLPEEKIFAEGVRRLLEYISER